MDYVLPTGGKDYPLTYFRNEDAENFLKNPAAHLEGKLLGYDIETTYRERYKGDPTAGLLAAKSRVRTLQFYDGKRVCVVDLFNVGGEYLAGRQDLMEPFFEWLGQQKLCAHNALFETCHTQRIACFHNAVQPLNIFCTLQMFRLIAQAQEWDWKKHKATLAALCENILGYHIGKETQTSDWSKMCLSTEQILYAGSDAIVTHQLFQAMEGRLCELGLKDIYMLNTQAQEPVAQMNIHGVGIDRHLHDELIAGWSKDMKEVLPQIDRSLNEDRWEDLDDQEIEDLLLDKVVAKYRDDFTHIVDSIKNFRYVTAIASEQELEMMWNKELNPAVKRAQKRVWKNIKEFNYNVDSAADLATWLEDNLDADVLCTWPRTDKTNRLKTDDHAFSTHPDIEELKPILKYKKAKKQYSTYGPNLQEFYLHHDDGSIRIHPNFSLTFTDTGRMSSFKPNMQNQTANARFRNMYIASAEDRRLLVSDFSQIEVRVAACISGEPGLLEVYDKGLDVYSSTASRMFGKPIEEVGKGTVERKLGKISVLSLMYGSGANRLREQARGPRYNLKLSEGEAKDIVERFRAAYPRYREWQLEVANKGEEEGLSYTMLGKQRALHPEMTYTTSMNTPVQGTAAEIMLLAMVKIFTKLVDGKHDARLVNVVHDEVIVDCHESETQEVSAIIKESMEESMLQIFPQATTLGLADVDCVRAWGQVEK